jgi:alpha-D-ribose 1-methylphosphonate 5-triphosphate synthase subunit PhnH
VQWQHNHASFPRGVDVFLTTPTQVVGLPRTTRIVNTQEA